MIGKIINSRYQIISLIAEGGMARVYKALDIEKDFIVALKILKSQFSGDRDFVDRFMQEAMAFARLNHENIVKLYDYGEVEGLYYLSLEYVEGHSLDVEIKESAPMPLEKVLDISIQVCEALTHAHHKKIIHRDIKPHNILVDRKGRIKVTDFGIAKAVSSATITHAGGLLGSVQYFSPEQAKGERATEKSDMYSLAVVMYEMLTGKVPFSGESHVSIALKHVQERPVNLRFHNEAVPKNLELIILKALSKNPEYRFSTAEEFKQAIRNYQKISGLDKMEIDGNLQERRISSTMVPRKRGNRKPAGKKNGVLAILLVMIVLWGAFQLFAGRQVTVPNLIGKERMAAEEILAQLELRMLVDREEFSEDFGTNIIIEQNFREGARVRRGTTIAVTLSLGNTFILVPDVVGASLAEAEAVLAENKLVVRSLEEIYHNDFPAGEVIYQEPARGTKVHENSLIDLVVSKGVKPLDFPAPRLTGISEGSAREIIQRLNLLVGNVTFIQSLEFSEGTVVGQNPQPNSLIREGQNIDLLVSAGPGPRKYLRAIPINMEEGGILKVVVQDIRGETVFLQERREEGFFSLEVEYYEEGRILVFLNERKINEVQVP